jgi:hypothetical protein
MTTTTLNLNEVRKLAESKGYKSPYYVPINNEVLQLALMQQWLREKRDKIVLVHYKHNIGFFFEFNAWDNYEQALMEGINGTLQQL